MRHPPSPAWARRIILAALLVAVASLLPIHPRQGAMPAYAQPGAAPAAIITAGATTPLVSTRGHFSLNTGLPIPPASPTGYDMTPNVPRLGSGHCTSELVVYVHGLLNDEPTAIRNFNLAKQSLAFNAYNHTLVGYTWDSDVTAANWFVAKAIAEQNGPKLARFLLDMKLACPGTAVRLIGHSLGTRVILMALGSLRGNTDWTDPGFQVASVHVLGAAIGNGEIATDTAPFFGAYVETQVCEFHNKFSPADDILETLFVAPEFDFALGETGSEAGIRLPSNYHQEDVSSQIVPADTDGDLIPDTGFGDNHSGYAGLIENGVFVDDGAMDLVASDWKRQVLSASCLKNLSANSGSSGFQDVAALGDKVYVVWEDSTTGEFDILFRASTDGGATFRPALNLSGNTGSSRFPEIAVAGLNVYVAWVDRTAGNAEVFFAASQDGGLTFGAATNLSGSPDADSNVRIAASGATAYVVWNSLNARVFGGSSIHGEVFFRAVTGGGTLPGGIINISETPDGFSDMPYVAASFSAAYVVWTEGAGIFGGLGEDSDIWGRQIFGGSTAGDGKNLSEALGTAASLSVSPLAAASGENIHVAWNDDATGAMDTYLRTWVAGEAGFGPARNVSQTAGHSFGIDLAVDGSDAYVVWSDGGATAREVFLRAIRDHGATLDPSVNLSNNTGLSVDPQVAAFDNKVYVSWHDQPAPGSYDTMFRASLDGGLEFIPALAEPPLNLSANPGDTWVSSVAASGDHFYAAWTDFSPGAADILFRAGNIRELAPFQGTVSLSTPDRGVLPLKRLEVNLFHDQGREVAFTDDLGRYRMALPEGVTTGRLRVFLGDEDNILEVQHVARGGIPAFIDTGPIDLTVVQRGDLVFSATAPNFQLNGAGFTPTNGNVTPLMDFPHLAGIYYYSLTALDFARNHLPGLRLDQDLPLEVVGFSSDADAIVTSFFTSGPQPTLHLKTRGPLPAAGSAGDPGGSRMADGVRPNYEIDTLFHEVGHYLIFESLIGGENAGTTKDRNLHPNLAAGSLNCHWGYAQLNSSCAWNEGVAYFLSAVTTDTMLTDPGHAAFHAAARTLVTAGGAHNLESVGHVVGPRRAGPPPFLVLNTSGEEFALARVLWDVVDNTPAEDPVNLPITPLWRILTKASLNPGNAEIITTYADLYTVLTNSGAISLANLNQIFGSVGICIDANGDLVCNPMEVHGSTTWSATVPQPAPIPPLVFAFPFAGYAYGASRPEVPFDPAWALSIRARDDLGNVLDNMTVAAHISLPDGEVADDVLELESTPSLAGFFMPGESQATLTFTKPGYAPGQVTFDSAEYLNGVMAGGLFALEVAAVLERNNTRPQAGSGSATVQEETVVNVGLVGFDADGDPLTFAIVTGPATGQLGAVIPIDAISAWVTYTPLVNFTGQISFTYIANDGRADSAPGTVTLTFTPVQDPPVANAGPDQSVAPGALVTLTGAASSDPDGDPLTFSWSAPGIVFSNPASPAPTATFPLGTTRVTLTVTDTGGLMATDTVDITVRTQPVASFAPDIQPYHDPVDGAAGVRAGLIEVTPGGAGAPGKILLAQFQAELTYDGACLIVLAVRPLNFSITELILDNLGTGLATFRGEADPGVYAPAGLGHALTRLVGSATQPCTLGVEVTTLIDSEAQSIDVPATQAINLLRGDARSDGNVTIADALFVAQYLAGTRASCTELIGTDCLHLVNAASVRQDGAFDRVTIADALFLAQYLAGLRDDKFALAP